jgi:WD40 repeat protein
MFLFGSASPSLSKIKYSPDGRYLLSTSYEYDFWAHKATSAHLIVHDVESGEVIRYHNFSTPALWDIAISPDGKTYAALSEMDPESETSTISLWDMDTGNLVDTIESNNCEATSIAFTPDNKSLIVSFLNRKNPDRIVIFDLDTGLETKIIKERSVANIQFSGDGRIFAAGSTLRGEVIIWDSNTYEEIWRIMYIRNPPDDIALSSDGELLVVVDESALMAWNVSSKKQILNMDSWDQIKWYQCVDISNDGKFVAVVASLDEDSKYNMDSDTFSESFGSLDNNIDPSYGNVVFIYDVQDIKTNEYKESFFDFIIRLGRTLDLLQKNLIYSSAMLSI